MKIHHVTKLPEYLRNLQANIAQTQKDLEGLNYLQKEQTKHIKELRELCEEVLTQVDALRKRNAELEHMITVNQHAAATKSSGKSTDDKQRFADNHLLDQFYLELENSLRGPEAEIKEKQRVYMPLFKKSKVDYKKYPVIDLGSGRGEFLELLHEAKIRGIGVDLNETMVQRMKEKKFEAVNDDAIGYLLNSKSNSLGGVVGFHIAEHVPFDQLLTLIAEAQRTLVDGGFLMLETPNPENVSVGAYTFHMDPSHLKPLPPALMKFMAEFKGFRKVEIMRLQPEMSDKDVAKVKDTDLAKTYTRLYGPRDYALVAYK